MGEEVVQLTGEEEPLGLQCHRDRALPLDVSGVQVEAERGDDGDDQGPDHR
ncbi:hypothetical protein NGB36_05210 [Streptomyces sp. RB6PN25]|uniref:Uncharacterized protein n=1 Tax=Streptomyces humicola TaxID=2953240 RepID=A0ABT1PSU3_9ACTN|nr:hypothetical protein [Streptomyces humicola]MCQ4080005.1 hypothetical protein [Streptomyces humicola]